MNVKRRAVRNGNFARRLARYLRDAILDYRDAGAAPTDEVGQGSVISSVATLVVGAGVPLLALLNHLTPAFRDIIDFRLRTVIAIVLCSVASFFCLLIVTKKDTSWSLERGGDELTYHYSIMDRLFAKILFPVTISVVIVAIGEIRFFYGAETSFAGRIYDHNRAVVNASVDFLDRDGRTLCQTCLITDSEGEFYAKLRSGGRVVSLKVKTSDSVTECILRDVDLRGVYNGKTDLLLDRACHG